METTCIVKSDFTEHIFLNPSNAKATFILSTVTQRLLKTILTL